MKNKLLWLLVSYTVIMALLLSSCSQPLPEKEALTTSPPETTPQEPTPPEGEDETTILPEIDNEAHIVFEFSQVDTEERAVAFHSISLLNMDGQIMDEQTRIFGTNDMDGLLGEGWLDIENLPDIGGVQWAGGYSSKASMNLPLPEGCEGLLLETKSIAEVTLMDVTVNGEKAATLRVDERWYSGYVPVGEAAPGEVPGEGPVWSEGHYFPRFPDTSERIFAFSLRTTFAEEGTNTWEPSWRINESYYNMMALTLVGMQGIINRYGPRVYLNWNDRLGNSGFWLEQLEAEPAAPEVIRLDMDSMSAFSFLMRRYSHLFAGAVVYDPEVPDTINLATMIAGLEDRIMLAPEQLELPGMPEFESIKDLRQLVQQQGWEATNEDRYRIYQWVYDNLWTPDSTWLRENSSPPLERRIIGIISPGPPTSIEYTDLQPFWPLGMASRDYMVALRLPAIYLSTEDEPDASLFDRFLEDAPSPIPVTGTVALFEEGVTALASRHGDLQTAISWPGTVLEVGSLTVFSGVRPEVRRYEPEINPDRILATLGDGPLATMFCTDGDAIYYLLQRGFQESFGWADVQDQRFGWTISPLLAELAPVIWNYYVESRSGVSLMAGVCGAGYVYPQLMDSNELDEYLQYTARYLDMTGLRVIHVDNNLGPWTEEIATSYYRNLHNDGYLGAIIGFGGFPVWGQSFYYNSVPAPGAWTVYKIRSQNEGGIANHITSSGPGEEFIDITFNQINPVLQMVDDPDASRGRALLIPRDYLASESCCLAVMSGEMSLLPGDYVVSYRMKVVDNSSDVPVAAIYVGHEETEWQTIAYKTVAPSDFQQDGQYQDFSLPVSLDTFARKISFQVDYLDSSTELYFDSIRVTRSGGALLPDFNVVMILIMLDPSEFEYQSRAPERFTTEFENAGGIVLTPDEYMAALNPKFMIEFATPMLGAGHPALVQAQDLLYKGNFLDSLLIVREALRDLR